MASGWFRPRNIFIAGGLGAAVFLFPRSKKQVQDVSPIGNPFNTYGVQNIANRYSSGGGTSTHMPGHASQRGDAGTSADKTPNEQTGIGTASFNEKFADQKIGESNEATAAYRQATLGNNKGK